MRRNSLALVLALVAATVGCDTSGIHPLGKPLDITPVCDPLADADHTTWYRTMVNGSDEPIGTEIVLLGFDPNAAPTTGSHCMQRIKIYRSTTTEEHLGRVELTGPGAGTHTEEVRCTFPQQPGVGVLNRRGAECFDLSYRGLIESGFTFAMSAGNILEITWAEDEAPLLEEDFKSGNILAPEMLERVAAGTYRYMEVGDLLASLDLATMEGAVGAFQVYNTALLSSQARLAGFGSGRMSRYNNLTSSFVGLVRNDYTVRVENIASMPRTTISYQDFEELTGLVVGSDTRDDQVTVVNFSGNGGMTGAVNFYLRRDRIDASSAVVGSLDYIDCIVSNGFGSGGSYILYLEEPDMTFVLDVAAVIGYDDTLPGYGNFDMSPILPPTL